MEAIKRVELEGLFPLFLSITGHQLPEDKDLKQAGIFPAFIRQYLRERGSKEIFRFLNPFLTSELTKFFPEFSHISSSISSIPHLDTDKKKIRFYETCLQFFKIAAEQERFGLVLWLDDLHAMSEDVFNVVHYIASNLILSPFPLILVLSYRDTEKVFWNGKKQWCVEFISSWLNDLESDKSLFHSEGVSLLHLQIERFKEKDIASLLNSLVGEDLILKYPAFSSWLYEKTDGNVFYLSEWLKYLFEGGVIHQAEEGWQVESFEYLPLPKSLSEIVIERLNPLRKMEEIWESLKAAAIFRTEFGFEIWQKFLEIEYHQLIEVLAELVRLGLLRDRLEDGQLRISFCHQILRESVLSLLDYREKKEFHKRAAQLLEEFYQQHFEDIAYHWLKSHEAPQSHLYRVFLRAAEEAEKRHNYENAVFWYKETLFLSSAEKVIKLLRKIASLQEVRGYFDEAIATLQNALTLAEYQEQIEIQLNINHLLVRKGEFKKALTESLQIEEMLNSLPGEIDKEQYKFEILLERISALMYLGQIIEAEQIPQDVLSYFDRIGDEMKVIRTLNAIGGLHLRRGNYEEAQNFYQKGYETSESKGDQSLMAKCLGNLGLSSIQKGEYEKGESELHQSMKLAEQIGDKPQMAASLINLGSLNYYRGKLREAVRYLKDSFGMYKSFGDRLQTSACLNNLGAVLSDLGEYEESVECYKRCLRVKEEIGDRYGVAVTLNNIASNYGEYSQNPEEWKEGIKLLERSLEILKGLGTKQMLAEVCNNLSSLYLRLQESAKALDYVNKALLVAKEAKDRRMEAVSLRYQGEAFLARNDLASAEKLFKEALEIGEEVGAKGEVAEMLLGLAKIYKILNKKKEAKESFTKAKQLFEEIGAKHTLEKMEKEYAGYFPKKIRAEKKAKISEDLPSVPLYIYTFGELKVFREGANEISSKDWVSRKTKELFAYTSDCY
ncbi:MAG: tetratricopeptide repeat protein [Candidatus Edwardsbacteria bacterium]